MKKSTTTKRARGSSSSSFDNKRFVSADAEAHFQDSVKRRAGLKERGFDIDYPYLADFESIVMRRGCQELFKPPKDATMTVVREFYGNAFEGLASIVTIWER